MGSVIKKRRKRMAKKKHRKLLKKTRVQRRRLGKSMISTTSHQLSIWNGAARSQWKCSNRISGSADKKETIF